MPTLVERVTALAQALGAEAKSLRGRLGGTTTVAYGVILVSATGTITASSLAGFSGATRISIGRYRFTFSAAQPDTNFGAVSSLSDAVMKAVQATAETTTYVEVSVRTIATVPAMADASKVTVVVRRKV